MELSIFEENPSDPRLCVIFFSAIFFSNFLLLSFPGLHVLLKLFIAPHFLLPTSISFLFTSEMGRLPSLPFPFFTFLFILSPRLCTRLLLPFLTAYTSSSKVGFHLLSFFLPRGLRLVGLGSFLILSERPPLG